MKNKKQTLLKFITTSTLILGASLIVVPSVSYSQANKKIDLQPNGLKIVRQQAGGGEAGGGNPGEPVEGGKPEDAPKVVHPNFDSFKEIVKNAILAEIPKLAPVLDDGLARRKKEIAESTELNAHQKLTRQLYLRFFEKFLTKFKSIKTVEDLDKIGISFNFPKLLSTDKEITIGNLKYRGSDFDNVGIGATDPTDYNKFINETPLKDESGADIPNSFTPPEDGAKEVNNITPNDLSSEVTKYMTDFVGTAIEIFLNNEDFPVDGKDVDLATDEKGDAVGIFGDKPKNFDTWNDYIESKIKIRSNLYDISANQQFFQKETQENPTPVPEDPVSPPTIPTDLLPRPAEPVPVSPAIENIPSLVPMLNPLSGAQRFENGFADVVETYKSGTEEEKKIKSDFNFYFFNPINTRFDYTVTKITIKDNSFIATVKITDTVVPGVSRTYDAEIDPFKYTFEKAFVNNQIFMQLKKRFIEIYDVFGIGKDQDYNKLLDSTIRQDLFNAVFLAVKTFSDETTFENEKKEIIDGFASNTSFTSTLSETENNSQNAFIPQMQKKADELLSKYLEARGINTDGFTARDLPRTFWELMGQSLESAINGFPFKSDATNQDGSVTQRFVLPKLKQNLETKDFSNIIKQMLESNNFDINEFNQGFIQLQKNAVIVKEKSSFTNIPFESRKKDVQTVFDGFVNFANLFPLISKVSNLNEQSTPEDRAKVNTEVTEALQKLQTYINENKQTDSTSAILIIILSVISGLIALGTIGITIGAIKRKKISRKSYATIAVSATFTIASLGLLIAMIIVLLGGI